jgi:DNA-binding CsgD family transcriptional regulator
MFLIDVLVERDSARATADAIEQMPIPPGLLPTWTGAALLVDRARLRLARGRREAAVADLRAAGDTAGTLGVGPLVSGWRTTLALALGPEDAAERRRLAEDELALARRTGCPRPQGIALRTLGQVSARGDEALAHLQESEAILRDGPSRLEHARSLVALGGALRRDGRLREARPVLGAGLAGATACGADRLRTEAEEELRAAGGRRPRAPRTGLQMLTPSETRVARLAAGGHTNVEIAQRLFVSVKTVETHLAHVYEKLGLSGAGSRGRLASLLAAAAGA